ncbi:hypothetical protein Poli38472_003389 [Pythium oligandrum]|uniref:Histone-lysine N-methyltransferase, H3 lysine-79 specific n=1 Tax=Pythium oligandrum TaxID=41045 RepID=A0A8K1FE08_PYTOL|nr:hypothetical protein Poli38472_003389 [Pythium oligandrum]|eukprot:TMW57464.1 hypothetical protein Poli38472_003389 [Pythium oligandrum]
MLTDLSAIVTELQRLSPRLQAYEPQDPTWQQAETRALAIREDVRALLSTPEGVQKLRASDALQDMKRLVPENAREEISELPVADFVLGMLFVKPFITFEEVYRGYGAEYGKELSREARESSNNIKSSYIYGEILFFPFAEAIRFVAPSLPEHPIFYDLGSGTGKAVVAASLLQVFDQAIGIEALQPLVTCAEKRVASLRKKTTNHSDIDFISGDLLTHSWADGDVVFCHGTCFNDNEWNQISLAAEKMKQGAFFLSTSHVLYSALFEVVKSYNFTMSWGTATLYIHRRRRIGRWAAQMLRGGRATRTDLLEQQQAKATKSDETREG